MICVPVHVTTEALVAVEDNTVTAQRILEDYSRIHAVPPQPRNNESQKFPESLFNTELDLLDSQDIYRNILSEFDSPADFGMLLDQVQADSINSDNMFQGLNMGQQQF